MQTPFHQEFTFVAVDPSDGRGAAASCVVHRRSRLQLCQMMFAATAIIFGAGPTRIGIMMPASAASIAPRTMSHRKDVR